MKVSALLAVSCIAITACVNPILSSAAWASDSTSVGMHTPGYPLMKGLSGPEELATLMEASLKKDSHGNALLDAARCKLNGSCATPRMYLEAIYAWHPKSGFGLSDADLARLPSYIRSLKNAVIKDTSFYSARLIQVNGEWRLDLNSGFKRQLMAGEVAWTDMQTGEVILLENCGNVALEIPKQVTEVAVQPPPCVRVEWVSNPGDENYLGALGSESPPPSKCWKIDEGNGVVVMGPEWPHDCDADRTYVDVDGVTHHVHCDFGNDIGDATRLTGSSQEVAVQKDASWVTTGAVPVKNVAYFPAYVASDGAHYEIVVCRTRSDHAQYMAAGVRSVHFRKGVAVVPDDFWHLKQ